MKKSIEPNACPKRQAIIFKQYSRAIVHMLFAGVIAGAAIAPSNALAQAEPKVLGKTIGEWSVKWWQWAFAIPASTNPMLHDDNDKDRIPYDNFCHIGQQGPVWFLAGVWNTGPETRSGEAERSCTVPVGKHILFPIANSFWIQTPGDDEQPNPCGKDDETCWRTQANDFLPPSIGGDLVATLDPKPTFDPKDPTPIIFNPETPIIRSQSPVFTAFFPPENVIKLDFHVDVNQLTGRPIVSDGFWVMLPPLSPGKYELHFKAGNPDQPGFQDVTYHLTVGKP